MLLTPNYNLKKPKETDPIDILDLNDNADIIDAEFKKRPVASGGDVSGMTVKTLEDITTEFLVPEAGESTKTFLGKVKKFFEDTKNWMTGVCLIGQIVNNCVTDNAKLPLSAAQGKALMDLYTVLNTNLKNVSYIQETNITTLNSSVFGNAVRYGNIVCLSGKNNVNGTTSFTLPEGFRPSVLRHGGQATYVNGMAGTKQLEINPNGRVVLDAYCVFVASYSVE